MIYTAPSAHDFSQNPALRERVLSDLYYYYRFVNVEFASEVCRRFEGELRNMPVVNLHGDAHLEQYAIVAGGRGLDDFDASTTGPAVIDLVRFGASIVIAHQVRGWGDPQPAIDRFFSGYRDALADPDVERPEPPLVARVRQQFSADRRPFLQWADSLMKPLAAEQRSRFDSGYQGYVALMREEHPELPPSFWKLEKVGRVQIGVGSALDVKLLLRIAGPSDAPDDDVILEVKEVRDLRPIPCVHALVGDAFRILLAQARMSDVPPRFMARVPRVAGVDRPFWIHEWRSDYVELDVHDTLASAEELAAVAYDVGVQLGRGHARHVAAPIDAQVRRAQLATLAELEPKVRRAITETVAMTEAGWRRFKQEALSGD